MLRVGRGGPDACWARIIFHVPPSVSLVGNDWIILQMNRSICLAHKRFPAESIKSIKLQSERMKKIKTRRDFKLP